MVPKKTWYSIPKTKKYFGYRGHATPNAFPKAMIFLGNATKFVLPDDMIWPRNAPKKMRRHPTEATQESEKKSAATQQKQPKRAKRNLEDRNVNSHLFGWTCLRSDPLDFFSLSWVAWVGVQRIFFVAFLVHITALESVTFVAFPQKYHRIGERTLSRVPPVTKIFLVFGIEHNVFLGTLVL